MNTHGARDLVVDSVTGVDLALPVAGAGARCFAFIVDWLIRATLFSAWYGVAALLHNGRWSLAAPLNPGARWFIFVVAPAVGIYFLYHIALEVALHGRTPGKRMAGIHIVARNGSLPSVSALLIRNVFRLVDSLPLFYGVGLVATLVTRDHVRIGDMAAGTLLAYERADLVLPDRPPGHARDRLLGTADAEIVNELLLRWSSLDSTARRSIAIAIVSRYMDAAAPRPDDSDDALRAHLERLTQGRAG